MPALLCKALTGSSKLIVLLITDIYRLLPAYEGGIVFTARDPRARSAQGREQ